LFSDIVINVNYVNPARGIIIIEPSNVNGTSSIFGVKSMRNRANANCTELPRIERGSEDISVPPSPLFEKENNIS